MDCIRHHHHHRCADLFISTIATKSEQKERRRQEERDRLVRERAARLKLQQQEAERQRKQQAKERAAAFSAAKRKREEQARLEDKKRVDALGKSGAALVKRAKSSVQQIESSEAAREGWLGEIDFAPDIEEIEGNLLKARALRGKADDLSSLPKPSDDDRRIIAEAKAALSHLERKTDERVKLLDRCATEADLIDDSLRKERDDAKLAAKRAELHGELAAMLFGVEAGITTQPNQQQKP